MTTLKHILTLPNRRYAVFISVLHWGVAIIYKFGMGIDIAADPNRNTWDWFWQSIPVELLREQMLPSIWNLHSQPPLYNLFIGLIIKLSYPSYLQVLQGIYIFLGGILSGLLFLILVKLLPALSPRIVFVCSVTFALNPSMFLYEAYMLYSMACAFLIVVNVFFLSIYDRDKSAAPLHGFLISLTFLIMSRSSYHALLLLVAAGLAIFVASQKHRKQVFAAAFIMSIIVFGWYAKNYYSYGFFGGSSWYGMGLWKIASVPYPTVKLKELAGEGRVDLIVAENRAAFQRPVLYQIYGFNKQSNIQALSRDDYNNINIPDISRVYFENAMKLIARKPSLYFQSVYMAYRMFCRPSSEFKHVILNATKIQPHVTFYENILQGRKWMQNEEVDYGSFLFFLLPLALIIYILSTVTKISDAVNLIRNDTTMLWMLVMITYTVAVSCAVEFGEQERFKFDIEQIIAIFLTVVFVRFAICLHETLLRLYARKA